MMLVRSLQRWFGRAIGLIVLLTITGCPTNPPATLTTQILHFTATPNPVPPGGVTRLSWHAIEPGVFADAASCSLSSHTYGEPDPEPANEVDCQDTQDFSITANVSFQLNVLEHPYDPDDPQPYLTQALLVTTTTTPVTVDIEPLSVSLPINQTQSFTAAVTGATDSRVTWSATCGSTTGSGDTIAYTAPATAGTCTLTATSTADASRSATATIDVLSGSASPWRLEPSPLTFEGLAGDAAPAAQSLTIHNDATVSRSFTLSSATMVNLNPTSGTLPAGASTSISVSVEACPQNDPPGTTTTATITATGGGGSGTASVARTCGDVPDVGMIDVIITGLPPGTDADVYIEGQGWQFWPKSSVLLPDMPPGGYQMTAHAVTANGTIFQPTPTNSNFTVTAGETTSVAIAYAPSMPPVIAVSPSSRDFGSLEEGSCSSSQSFSVTNTGGGSLSGSASVSAPFEITSGASYSGLASGGTAHLVQVRFCPTVEGPASRSVSFTGGGGASATATGTTPPPSAPASVFNYAVTSPYANDGDIRNCAIGSGGYGQVGTRVVGPSTSTYRWSCINWSQVSAATSYEVVRRALGSTAVSSIATVSSATTYVNLNQDTTRYEYGVRAINAGGSSSIRWSGHYTSPAQSPVSLTLRVPGIGGYVVTDRTNTATPIGGSTRSIEYGWANPWPGQATWTWVMRYQIRLDSLGSTRFTAVNNLDDELFISATSATQSFPRNASNSDLDGYDYHWRAFVETYTSDGTNMTGVAISEVTRLTVDNSISSEWKWGPNDLPGGLLPY